MTGVRFQSLGSLCLVTCLHGFEVAVERDLGVDDDVLAPGKLDDEIRPDSTVVGSGLTLLDEVTVFDHARCLDNATQLQLSPSATDLGCAQRRDELGCLKAQLRGGF